MECVYKFMYVHVCILICGCTRVCMHCSVRVGIYMSCVC